MAQGPINEPRTSVDCRHLDLGIQGHLDLDQHGVLRDPESWIKIQDQNPVFRIVDLGLILILITSTLVQSGYGHKDGHIRYKGLRRTKKDN